MPTKLVNLTKDHNITINSLFKDGSSIILPPDGSEVIDPNALTENYLEILSMFKGRISIEDVKEVIKPKIEQKKDEPKTSLKKDTDTSHN